MTIEPAEFKIQLDKQLALFLDDAIKEVDAYSHSLSESLKYAKKILLSGGKRLRGLLCYESYILAGGKEKQKILKIAAAIEMFHLLLLIHDDIIDNATLRHGNKALHLYFADQKNKTGKADHYGRSLAIVTGDLIYSLAYRQILAAYFDNEKTMQILKYLSKVAAMTAAGQSEDINSNIFQTTEKSVFKLYKYKTAKYSFELPLFAGLIFAGKNNEKLFDDISEFSENIGVAYQIQDDILDIFGSNKKGKTLLNDFTENKATIVTLKMFNNCTNEEKIKLNKISKKKIPSFKDIELAKKLATKSGALKYATTLSEKYTETAEDIAQSINAPLNYKNFLLFIANTTKSRIV